MFFLRYNPMLDTSPTNKTVIDQQIWLILLPAQLMHEHWSILGVLPLANTVVLADPLVRPNGVMLQKARKIIRGLHEATSGLPNLKTAKLVVHDTKLQVPGTLDCGPLSCLIGEKLIQKEKLHIPKNTIQLRMRYLSMVLREFGEETKPSQ